MRRKLLYVALIIGALVLIGVFIVLPIIDGEMMKAPAVKAVTSVQSGDMRGLRACFTQDGTIGYQQISLPVATVVEGIQPYLSHGEAGSLRFWGYSNVQRSGKQASADVTIIYFYAGDDSPYRSVPVRVKGHVELEKTGWFTWKIKKASTDNPEFGEMLAPQGL